jgi:menaquinone-specific isochorismate synthase
LSTPATEKFRIFLIEILGKLSGKTNTILVSYFFEPNNFEFEKRLNVLSKNFEKYFYWERPETNHYFLALGELFSVTEKGKNRFASTEKKIRNWSHNTYSNWKEGISSIPLFVGGMKFIPENDTELWDNYPDSNWIVPRILIYKKDNKEYIFYNFLLTPDSSKEKIIEEFNTRISNLFTPTIKDSSNSNFRVLSSLGNGPKEKKKWIEKIKKVMDKIESDYVKKVVLSRSIEFNLDNEPNIFDFIDQLKNNYPDCYIFIYHSGKSSFFGASPEKLIKLNSDFVETDSLAGSAPRGKDASEDKLFEEELLSSAKNLYEHKSVIEFIEKQLAKLQVKISYNPSPGIKKLHSIQHLWTQIKADIKPDNNIFNILENLHPTPAVCGVPVSNAIQIIKEMEDFSRGMYAGIIGWFNFSGNGEFSVAIRSALLKGKKLYAFAGSGIVEGSDPQTEYKETELKLKPILSLLENEIKN